MERSASFTSHVSKAEAEVKEREKDKSAEKIHGKEEEGKERPTSQTETRPVSAAGNNAFISFIESGTYVHGAFSAYISLLIFRTEFLIFVAILINLLYGKKVNICYV